MELKFVVATMTSKVNRYLLWSIFFMIIMIVHDIMIVDRRSINNVMISAAIILAISNLQHNIEQTSLLNTSHGSSIVIASLEY